MNEIKCPECGKVFSVDEASYASIVNQVRTKELEEEIRRRVAEVEKQQQLKHQSDKLISDQAYQQKLNAKDQEIEKRNADIARLEEQVKSIALAKQAEFDKALANKDIEIAQLKEKSRGEANANQLEHEKQLAEKDAQILRLRDQIKVVASDKQAEFDKVLAEKETEILKLQGQVAQSKSQTQVAILEEQNKANELIRLKDSEIATWKGKLENEKNDAIRREQDIRQNYELQLKQKQEMVDYYKDMKTKLSTKMVGETLEAHCNTQFNTTIRPIMPYAYFEKDNDASGGSKGDFIFRDYDGDFEYISIMFEMKNEMDTTASKHKNEDFLKKLNDDRCQKKCEYAVLVSLLEPDNEMYNAGIVDVSNRYPKMYVIRPQFFIPLITLLVQASRKSIAIQKQLVQARSQSMDITNFEEKVNDFKEKFGRNFRLAEERFEDAIAEIDKSIDHLQKIKSNLLTSGSHLRAANNQAEDLTIRKLTYKNPTMKAKFEEARKSASNTNIEVNEGLDEILPEDQIDPIIEDISVVDDKESEIPPIQPDKENVDSQKMVTRKAVIGDTIIKSSDNQVGEVIDIQTLPNGIEKLIIKLEDGTTGSVYNNTRLFQVLEK